MALMFPRLARNYAKDGYFPTDNDTLQRVLNALSPSLGEMRIIDPFAGEGVAIAECKHHLGAESHTDLCRGIPSRTCLSSQAIGRSVHPW